MWEKIKNWWQERKERRRLKKEAEEIELEILVNNLLGGPDYVMTDLHTAEKLFCSVYFEREEEMVAVDLSQENEGIIHFMLFTKDKLTDYTDDDPERKEITICVRNGTVGMKHTIDGGAFWCCKF